jgi:hypothetical protein
MKKINKDTGISKLNKEWHQAHPMPAKATIDQRIAWHLEHAKHCSCRKIEGKLLEEMKKRHIQIPS